MTTVRLTGTITAMSPILITRPGQEDAALTMNVVRNQVLVRVHVIPGETIKGLLRHLAYALCVDAARNANRNLNVTLQAFYRQTAGGIGFTGERQQIGEDIQIRVREPLLSLFGAAQPRITGRLAVQHATAQPLIASEDSTDIGLPPGVRRDAITANPELTEILGEEERRLWARQQGLIADQSAATRRVEDAKRILGRARRTPGADLSPLEAALDEAETALAQIKEEPDYRMSVLRMLRQKRAAPPGLIYDHGFEISNATSEEIGLFLAALQAWNLRPRIGGGLTTGYGRIRAEYFIERLTTDGLQRNQTWVAAGKVTVGDRDTPAIVTNDDGVQSAIADWSRLESSLATATSIFQT